MEEGGGRWAGFLYVIIVSSLWDFTNTMESAYRCFTRTVMATGSVMSFKLMSSIGKINTLGLYTKRKQFTVVMEI